ncbi:DUF3231 family protein [Piscibacillus halophilus]|uniref:DUF3231 family protein n=1 Tax=Piscibacillus halophilus TaxID=571933 RepID=A0A1H9GIY1_9BACI|nr:DUF3231 family protein [Piscibacillus halophilus]SEQ49858.1 Protein of unknown function [Piscibacillus halophilus]
MGKIYLTSNEIGTMWTQYIQNSLYIQILKYFIETVEDNKIKELIQDSLILSERINNEIKSVFEHEDIPIPHGFNDQDVNLKAEKLFLDPFMIQFLEHTLKAGVIAHGSTLIVSTRKDIRQFFTETTEDSLRLFNKCTDLALSKGLLVRAPSIKVQPDIEYVEKKKYMSSFSNRPLNMVEITHLFENIKTNTVGEMITMAFAQTTNNDTVKKFMNRGLKISQKHIRIFQKTIKESYIDAPIGSNSYVTNSKNRVFSDKLMMHFLSVLTAAGQGNYSTASTASLRNDLILSYQRLAAEIAGYAKDGADIMIEHGWLEEPPQAPDRKQLITD